MKAIRVHDDETNSLEWTDAPTPEVESDEVRIRVKATAVNRADLLQRRGKYPPPEGASEILGLEAAGTVDAIGDDVSRWETGDEVCALLPGGGYAEFVCVPADMLLPVPANIDLHRAAGIPEVFYTAYLNLVIEGNLDRRDDVLIHAGASGVGTAAIQVASLYDCRIATTASGSKLQTTRELGADCTIDRHNESFVDAMEAFTDGRGADVILDPVGADYLADNIESLAVDGRMVLIGLLGGARTDINLGRILAQRLRIIGSVLRSRSVAEKIELTDEIRRHLWSHFETGELSPVIDRMMPIEHAEEAHELLENNETVGKVILTV